MNNNESKLEIFNNKSILVYPNGERKVFYEGVQSKAAKKRYQHIKDVLNNDYLEKTFKEVNESLSLDPDKLTFEHRNIFLRLVKSITSQNGRAIIDLVIIQLLVKAIEPSQNIRLYQGSNTIKNRFSWQEGISMRTIDEKFVTPFLRKNNLLKLNKYGAFMTRTLAENYPYTNFYKAHIQADKKDWLLLTNLIEEKKLDPKTALLYILALLKNRSDNFLKLANKTHKLALTYSKTHTFSQIKELIMSFVKESNYKARIFEVAMHSLIQSLQDLNYLEGSLNPLTQMRSANKKHGNVGDIETTQNGLLYETWDAKYGKEYLRDELEELNDKLIRQQNIEIAGFVTDKSPILDSEIVNRIKEIEALHEVSVKILSFNDWVNFVTRDVSNKGLKKLGETWLLDMVDSLGQKRRNIAPIDEPCDTWLSEFYKKLNNL